MAIFGPKPWVNLLGKNVNFSTFWTSSFYSLERRFPVLEYHKKTFSWPILPKKKSWKNGHFWTKNMGYPLGKNVSLSSFWSSSFYGLERRYFVLEYRKRHFPGLYWLKKKIPKMAIFGPKRWVNPFFKKCQFLHFLNILFW